ncbi:C40 family peptidase [Luteococcus sp.]|uniref:C40 family peptidase n=1 Tax=Luteococcus sp. TaxID=1969402 RepID=UPI003735CA20
MSKFRISTSTAVAAVALGGGSLMATAPSAQAFAPSGNDGGSSHSAPAKPAPAQQTRTVKATKAPDRSGLVFGNRSEAIRQLQAQLTRAGFEVPRTGYFGTITQGALEDFQASKGITVTGRATARTLDALGSSSASTVRALAATSSARSVTSSVNSSAPSSSSAQAAVNFAHAQLGTPYSYGGTGNGGYDCSGLTRAAWRAAGVSIPRTSYAQWGGLQKVSTSNLQPGDLVIFYGGSHIGIYVGDGDVIHAPRPGKSVEKVSMSTMPVSGAVRPA